MHALSLALLSFRTVVYGSNESVDASGSESDVDACFVDEQGVRSCGGNSVDVLHANIPVVVVDEHHHVVDYWFSLPGVGENLSYNATLLHIDGHADYGLPLTKDLLAPFPRDLNKLREDLENDQFIVMAVRHGIIGRIVNIYPAFSRVYVHPNKKEVIYVTVGMHKSGEGWCECRARCRHKKRGCKRECEVDEEDVRAADCSVDREIEVVSYGINRAIKEGFSIDADQPFLIDFDEDFFAVEAPFVKTMLAEHFAKDDRSAGPVKRDCIAPEKWEKGDTLEALQSGLFGGFCARPPRVQQRERAVDVFMRSVGAMVLAMKENSGRRFDNAEMTSAVSKLARLNGTLLREVSDALCERQIRSETLNHDGGDVTVLPETVADAQLSEPDEVKVVRIASRYAWGLYKRVPTQGLRKLISYGFCIHCDEVPRAGYYLWACMGSSGKKDQTSGRLELHDASEQEVAAEMLRMRSMLLAQLPQRLPNMITVCRSSRDGYVPRALWPQIERGVLGIFKELSREWGRGLATTYDRDCYWGPQGPPTRLVLPIEQLLRSEGWEVDGQDSS